MNLTLRACVFSVVAVVAATLHAGRAVPRDARACGDARIRSVRRPGSRIRRRAPGRRVPRRRNWCGSGRSRCRAGRTCSRRSNFTAGSRDGGSRVRVGSTTFDAARDVLALSFSDDGDVTGPVGLRRLWPRVPGEQGFAYDSYAGLDVKDKIVVVLRYFPEDAEQQKQSSGALRRPALQGDGRARARREGLLVVTGPRSPTPASSCR